MVAKAGLDYFSVPVNYRSLAHCVRDLEKHGHLIRVKSEVDPDLEMAEIHRRVFQAGGPALYFENVKGSDFPAVSNLYGTMDRARFIFRGTMARVQKLIKLRADPPAALKAPHKFLGVPFTALKALPRKKFMGGPVLGNRTTIDKLPLIKSWPDDGGPFITLPQVFSEDPDKSGVLTSNLGMYRVQLAGNEYKLNEQIGLHYQIHRGIGVHHSKALAKGEKLRVSIFVGGPPAHAFAAVMPLPEGLPEVAFAGALAGRRFRFRRVDGHIVSTDADFCITGTIEDFTLPEGPFGDHFGYYAKTHDFPVLRVENVYHRSDAIWPFTIVGRPPQEDTMFGGMIHELTGPMVPASIPGLKSMQAVDAAGVHPLLLAVGSERYVPYAKRRPMELMTIAHAILGFGQASLAKYLMIIAGEDDPDLNTHDLQAYLAHVLRRADWSENLHFITNTTIDTLDYSGTGFNRGSKVVIAVAGETRRDLATDLPPNLSLPDGFGNPRMAMPGVLVVSSPPFKSEDAREHMKQLGNHLAANPGPDALNNWPLIIAADDAEFTARTLNNFLWTTFTRSNPSHDVHGVAEFSEHKHWGCRGPLIIDARAKPHHAPPLIEDPEINKRVDKLAAPGGELHGVF